MVVIASIVALAVTWAPQAFPAAIKLPRYGWQAEFLDPFRAIPIASIPSKPNIRKAYRLIDSAPKEAYSIFRKAYSEDPQSTLHIHGLLLSADNLEKIPEALELVLAEVLTYEKSHPMTPMTETSIPLHFEAAFRLGFRLKEMRDGDSGKRPVPIEKAFSKRVARFSSVSEGSRVIDRVQPLNNLLFAAVFCHKGMPGLARNVLSQHLQMFPKDGMAHFLMAEANVQTTYSFAQGNKQVPVPKEYRGDGKAMDYHYEMAAKLCTTSSEVLYNAGLNFLKKAPQKARTYWIKYLRLPLSPEEEGRKTLIAFRFKERGWSLPK